MTLSLWLILIYLLILPIIGFWGQKKSQENSLNDYFLAGGTVGSLSLLFTLYATQYSGNTFFGFTGRAYHHGLTTLFTVVGMMAVVAVWALVAKKLHGYAKEHHFLTITDYFKYRYNHAGVVHLANAVLILALCSYILSNFKAIGLLVEQLTDGAIPLFYGVFIMAFFMAIYESLGGMRSVILTDIFQGSLLLIGCLVVFFLTIVNFDGVGNLITEIQSVGPEQWAPLNSGQWRKGLSIIILFGLAISLYPHAIQRIYAARNWASLKRSLWIMFFMPLFTTLPLMIVSMAGYVRIPDLVGTDADRIILLYLDYLTNQYPFITWVIALYMAAAVAAIMSTIDSALLSINAALTHDVLEPMFGNLSQEKLTRAGKTFTWILMALSAWLATTLPQSIWGLVIIKLEVMLQIAPALILGLYIPRLTAVPIMLGIIVGLGLTVWLKFGLSMGLYVPDLMNIHAGVWALVGNILMIALMYRVRATAA